MQAVVQRLPAAVATENDFGHCGRVERCAEGEDRLPGHGHAILAILRAGGEQPRAADGEFPARLRAPVWGGAVR